MQQTPTWWHVAIPSSAIPLVFGNALRPEHHWGWRAGLLAPVAAVSSPELDRWFEEGIEPPEPDLWSASRDDALAGRQFRPASVRVVLVPRLAFVVTASLLALILGLGISRLRPNLIGPGLAVLGFAAILVALVISQPAMQLLSAAIPGGLALGLALSMGMLFRWLSRRRIQNLPTFRRESYVPPAPSGTGSQPRTSRNGATPVESSKPSGGVLPPQNAG